MPLKQHPTDPDKMVYASRQYDIPQLMEREALKLALEALEEIARYATSPWEDEWCGELANETLTAINALAQEKEKNT